MAGLTGMTQEMKDAPAVLMTYGRAEDAEDYVRAIARRSGQPCDWGYVGGRVVVHTLGDRSAVVRAIVALRWMEAAMQACSAGEDFEIRDGRGFVERLAADPHLVGE